MSYGRERERESEMRGSERSAFFRIFLEDFLVCLRLTVGEREREAEAVGNR